MVKYCTHPRYAEWCWVEITVYRSVAHTFVRIYRAFPYNVLADLMLIDYVQVT